MSRFFDCLLACCSFLGSHLYVFITWKPKWELVLWDSDGLKNSCCMYCTCVCTFHPWILFHQHVDLRKHAWFVPLFGLPHIWLIRFLFSAGTVFFSHNNSGRTVFSGSFSQNSASRTGLLLEFCYLSVDRFLCVKSIRFMCVGLCSKICVPIDFTL